MTRVSYTFFYWKLISEIKWTWVLHIYSNISLKNNCKQKKTLISLLISQAGTISQIANCLTINWSAWYIGLPVFHFSHRFVCWFGRWIVTISKINAPNLHLCLVIRWVRKAPMYPVNTPVHLADGIWINLWIETKYLVMRLLALLS